MELDDSPYCRATQQLIGKLSHEEICAVAWRLALYVADYRSRCGALPVDPVGQLEGDPSAPSIALLDEAIETMRNILATSRSNTLLTRLKGA
jgi:hypothetical protein